MIPNGQAKQRPFLVLRETAFAMEEARFRAVCYARSPMRRCWDGVFMIQLTMTATVPMMTGS